VQTITFYSYKGGSGRSLVVANVARHLARLGQNVVAVDFDLEAPGLHYKMNSATPGEPIPVIRGFVDYLHSYVTEGSLPESLSDYVVSIPPPPGSTGSIKLLPAGTVPSADYWHKLSRISWHDLFYSLDAPGVALFLEIQERIHQEFKPDFLLIDSRTGITEIGGVATTILPDTVVCLLLNNRENLDGARAVLRSIGHAPSLPGSQPVKIVPVLSRVPEMPRLENNRISEEAVTHKEKELTRSIQDFLNMESEKLEDTLSVGDVFILHSEPDLQISERLRIGGDKSPDDSILLRDYLRLFQHILPTDILRSQVGFFIKQIKAMARQDPRNAQQALEELTSLEHPDIYRELLRFYRRKKIGGDRAVRAAQKLWEITTRADDPLIAEPVLGLFRRISTSKYWLLMLNEFDGRFLQAVWRATGATDTLMSHMYDLHDRNKPTIRMETWDGWGD
jgi:MinD-like ATPase involved in chromosome partitioning or flagellar assembly